MKALIRCITINITTSDKTVITNVFTNTEEIISPVLRMSKTIVERVYHCYTLTIVEEDGYTNFSKLVESVDKARIDRQGGKISNKVIFGQWTETEVGKTTMENFRRAFENKLSHYALRKGIARCHAGTYIHPNLVPSIIIWRDPFMIFYIANLMLTIESTPERIAKPCEMPCLPYQGNRTPEIIEAEANLSYVPTRHPFPRRFGRARGRIKNMGKGRAGTSEAGGGGTTSVPETELHSLLTNLLQKPFTKARPSWLRNPKTGYPMELDMYNDELKIAVEYNGIQHYRIAPPLTNNAEELQDLRERDIVKSQLCRDNGVKLIVIPYTIPCSEFSTYLPRILDSLQLSKLETT